MLDKYIFPSTGNAHVDANIHVTEKRAPTDDSVRLLREMEDTVRKNMIRGLKLANTDIQLFIYEELTVFLTFKIIMKICNTDVVVIHQVNPMQTPEERANALLLAVGIEIASAVFSAEKMGSHNYHALQRLVEKR